MTIREYYRLIFGQAMALLGWSPTDALKADVNVVRLALEVKYDMLLAQAGKTREEITPRKKMTAGGWREMARRHNEAMREQSNA